MADEIIIETTSSQTLEVGTPGPQGPTGATGATGPQGPTIADENAPATNNILWQIRTSGFTAASGGRYVCNGTFTVTNPASGNNGELFQVVVASGTVTVNGVAYGASRWPVTVARISGAWTTLANTLTENLTLNGTNSTAPNQTAASGSSIMTRALVDARWSKWFGAIELVYYSHFTGGFFSTSAGGGFGSPISGQMVQVPNSNSPFSLVVPFWVTGSVRLISYWSDRNLTNGGVTGNIAVWSDPQTQTPTTNTTTSAFEAGTLIQTVFTANYGGSGQARFYVVDQTVNFGTVSGINAADPFQIKMVRFQRRGGDATDTSTDNIFLAGVHVFVL